MPANPSAPPPISPAVAAAAPVAIATPASAAPSSPSKPAGQQPRDTKTGQFKPSAPPLPVKDKVSLSAKKALNLSEDPSKTAAKTATDLRKKFERETGQTSTTEDDSTTPVTASSKPATAAETSLPDVTASSPDDSSSVPAAPVEPQAPLKVKVGDKEFSLEELQAALAEKEKLAKEIEDARAAAQAQAQAATPPPAPPTQEELDKQAAEIAQREAEWIAQSAAQFKADMTEQDVEAILGGGPEAIKAFQSIRQRDMASAVLAARKGIADALNPILANVFQSLQPVLEQHESVQRYSVQQQFLSKHKDFEPHMDLATDIAEKLRAQYPTEVSKMSVDQFIDEVARQTDNYLTQNWKRFGQPGTWRDANRKPVSAPAQATTTAPAPATTTAPVAPAAAPAVPPAPQVKPLSGNPPQVSAANKKSWQSGVASALAAGRR